MYMYVMVLVLFKIAFGLFCLGGGGGETAHLAFLLFVNFVFSMHPFFLFGIWWEDEK